MSNPPVPTLSIAGWISAPVDKADVLMSHFFEAEKSQTHLYGDNVSSLQWLVQRHGNDPSNMSFQLRSTLEAYLNRYFDTAQVTVNVNDDGTPRYELQVYMQVVADGKTYSIGKLLQVNNSKIQKIINLNNDGTSL
jgi:hypothetical protein